MQTIEQIVRQQKIFFGNGVTRPVAWRRLVLERLYDTITAQIPTIEEALRADLHKSPQESYMTEIGVVLQEISLHLRKVQCWAKESKARTPLVLFPSRSRIKPEPLGVVLIISPWNYPFNLTFMPLIGAVSAGNCAVVKLSTKTPNTSRVVRTIIQTVFDPQHVTALAEGHVPVEQLIDHNFDHIFYTGGVAFAHDILRHAAAHIIPTTLELGGKSPCIVSDSASVATAAKRVAWGKTLNAGQTCVAPDYVLVAEEVADSLVRNIIAQFEHMHHSEEAIPPHFPRIISREKTQQMAEIIESSKGKTVYGGAISPEQRYIRPTIVLNPDVESRLMREEIFAPILPVITYKNLDSAIDFINSRPKPLALYVFGNAATARQVIDRTSSGSVAVNDVIMQIANHFLPFGGVGQSGTGRYHGKASFELFSNIKSILISPPRLDNPARYAPYKKIYDKIIRLFLK